MERFGSSERQSVVLTTDCGADMDDQWTLAHLALSSEIRLSGVVTTHAPNLSPPATATAARLAGAVLDLFPLTSRPPVIEGANRPLVDDGSRSHSGADFIVQQARDHTKSDRLAVLVIGAATDTALALLSDATLGDRIEIIAMAFDGWPTGHDSFNVRNDPLAWDVLLRSQAPITIGDADVTLRQLAMTRQQAQELLGDCEPGGPYLVRLLDEWLNAHPILVQQVTGNADLWPVWDKVAVAHLLGMTSIRTFSRPSLRGGLGDDLGFDHHEGTNWTIDWITDIDASRLWSDFRRKMQGTLPMLPG